MNSQVSKLLPHLQDVAKFYRGFLFDLDALCGSSVSERGLIRASSIRCIKELLQRGKHVAVIQGAARRSQTLLAAARSGGLPQGVQAWTPGEFVYKSFSQGGAKEDLLSPWMDRACDLMPFLRASRAPRVFELSSIATPRRWSDLEKRGGPPLSDLEKSKMIRLASSVEDADLCYWDVHEGDDLGALLEASLELCVEYQVPMLYPGRSIESIKMLEAWCPRDSAESAAASLLRRGGNVHGISKLEMCCEGLGWSDEISSRDVLLVTPDLGDVAEASTNNMDALLVLGFQAEAQLAAYADAVMQEKAAARRHASVSQRMVEDSPAMMSAYQNPFTAVLRLPGLIADVTKKNAQQRERLAAAEAASKTIPPTLHNKRGGEPMQAASLNVVDTLELLEQWCGAQNVRKPASIMSAPLAWDDSSETARISPQKQILPEKDMNIGTMSNISHSGAVAPKQNGNGKGCSKAPTQHGARTSVEAESLDDLLHKLSKTS